MIRPDPRFRKSLRSLQKHREPTYEIYPLPGVPPGVLARAILIPSNPTAHNTASGQDGKAPTKRNAKMIKRASNGKTTLHRSHPQTSWKTLDIPSCKLQCPTELRKRLASTGYARGRPLNTSIVAYGLTYQ